MICNIIGNGHEASKYYALLVGQASQNISSAVKTIWGKGCTFDDKDWGKFAGILKSMYRSIKTRFLQVKTLHISARLLKDCLEQVLKIILDVADAKKKVTYFMYYGNLVKILQTQRKPLLEPYC